MARRSMEEIRRDEERYGREEERQTLDFQLQRES